MKKLIVLVIIAALFTGMVYFLTSETKKTEQEKVSPVFEERSLKDIIEDENLSNIEREEAIFSLVRESLNNGSYNESREYLKSLIIKGKLNGELKSAALANIFLIDEIYPREKVGSVEVVVLGNISKGSKITVVIRLFSKKDAKAIIKAGFSSYDSLGTPPIIPLNSTIWKGEVKKGEVKEAMFSFLIEEEGKIEVPISYKLNFDSIDYEKEGYSLLLDTSTGKFLVGNR